MEMGEYIEFLKRALQLEDGDIGQYLLKQDLLYKKIPLNDQKTLVHKALACGKKTAENLDLQFQSIDNLIRKKNVEIIYLQERSEVANDFYTFAEFKLPNQILLNETLIESGEAFLNGNQPIQELLGAFKIKNLLLGHEIFHYLEQEQKIFTHEKNLKYKVGFIRKKARLYSLSEIAATAFVKEYYHLDFSPILLNSLLIYELNPVMSLQILQNLTEE